ncbi:BZ3500_MvSof-1268-A1-R1_Chr1-3g01557 [Microbotryum saponariae]|uniref:BZ3500_MvSof-1268-A1-R1_Chr1-3g01557 protein n=1 Tax=Microbotryum saponariae TaxID=289078 RepID=A0A2X0MEP8_9BASI|nr:BZ3500_MvSof-1268-A1-R1_Chr1-3g01557 [Microbotryum saponariae]SCZ94025.1 BZ3501_MvSof-1269-A2-R1_Chr1-3g01159 [Microbotryum saponariae]
MGLLWPAREPAAGPAARLSSSSRSDQQNQLPAHNDNHSTDLGIEASAVQLCRTDSVMTVCTHCKARHWECERTKLTGHFSTCCSQGKVQLPPSLRPNPNFQQLLEGSDSGIPAFRENARSYNNALHSRRPNSCRQSAPNLCQNMAHLPGRGHRHSTWPRRRRQSHTKIYFDQARLHVGHRDSLCEGVRIGQSPHRLGYGQRMGPAPLSNTLPGPTHPQPSSVEHGNGDAYLRFRHQHYQVVSSLHPSAMPLRSPLLFPAGEDDCLPNIPLCSSNQAGSPFADEEDEDEEEGDEENGDGEPQIKGVEVASLAFTVICVLLAQTRRVLLNPALHPTCLPGVRDDGYSHVETDRLNLPPVASRKPPPHHGPRPRENTQHYQDAMACVVKYGKPSLFITVTCNPEWPANKVALGPNDQACNRPDLIARVFEAKLNRLCDDIFGNKQRAGCLGDEWRTVSLLYFVGRLWWMCQHTVGSNAPARGVHVPIRSHVQALWYLLYFSRQSNEATAFPVFSFTFSLT